MDTQRNKLTGFALIEFLIALGIIGILVGISIPVYRQFQPALQLSGAVRNLLADLRYAQQLAVTEQLEYCVHLFPEDEDKEYKVIQCEDSEEIIKIISLLEIDSIIVTGFTNNEVRYNPYGAVKEGGTIALEVDGKTKIIEVKPSGFVKITE